MSEITKKYKYEEVLKATNEYFNYDTLAPSVWVDKYALQDSDNNIYELTPDDMHWRIANELARIDKKYVNPKSADFYYHLLKDFKYIVLQGSPMSGIGNNLQITSLSNCFVVANENSPDSYSSVLKIDEELVQLMKRRGGVGTDLGDIRPINSPVENNALTSTGIVPFMERYSNTTREVAQFGRRGALLLSLPISHPEAENFIDAKMEKGKVTGANISIKLSDDFMNVVNDTTDKDVEIIENFIKQVENKILNKKNVTSTQVPFDLEEGLMYVKDEDEKIQIRNIWNKIIYYQHFTYKDGSVLKIPLVAKKLWMKFIYNAWKSAEPGALFWDKIVKESLAEHYPGFANKSTNPCFVGDTNITIKSNDISKSIKIKDLIDLYQYHHFIPEVLSYNEETKEQEWKKLISGQLTKKNVKIIKLNFQVSNDGGEVFSIKCTPDHLIYTVNEGYKDACKLNVNDVFIHQAYTCKLLSIEELDELQDVYDITVEDNHNFFANGILVHNCGELPLPDGDSCRLAIINLNSYVVNPYTKDAYFDFKLFKEHSYWLQRIMDNIVDLELEKIEKIIDKIKRDPESDEIKYRDLNVWKRIQDKCKKGRRTGSGITGEGDMIASMNLIYGTQEATKFAEEVHKTFAIELLRSSVDMSEERGSFPIFDNKYEMNNPFIKRIEEIEPSLIKKMRKVGRRNIGLSTIAPTGSVSVLTQTTSGIECAFLISYTRRRKINPSDKNIRVDFVDEVGDSWQNYNVFHKGFIDWFVVNQQDLIMNDNILSWNECKSYLENLDEKQINKLIEQSPYFKATSNDVNWVEKVRMQGAIQKWIDHSISVTVNIPEDTSVEVINDIYLTGWKEGCKGMTVYRDKCRSGVLINKEEQNAKDSVDEFFKDSTPPKRPKTIECDVIHFTNKGDKWVAFVGKIANKPYEVFTGPISEFSKLPTNVDGGEIVKNKQNNNSSYIFQYYDKNDNLIQIGELKKSFNDQFSDISRMVSALLRHGMPIFYIVQLLGNLNLDGDLITTWKTGVIRILKKYIKEEKHIKGITCTNCGSESISMIEGCMTCQQCGSSKCG